MHKSSPHSLAVSQLVESVQTGNRYPINISLAVNLITLRVMFVL